MAEQTSTLGCIHCLDDPADKWTPDMWIRRLERRADRIEPIGPHAATILRSWAQEVREKHPTSGGAQQR